MQVRTGDLRQQAEMPAPPAAAELKQRAERIGVALERARLDAAIVSSEANFTYMTGYTTSSWVNVARPLAVLVEPGRCAAIVSRVEAERMEESDGPLELIPYTDPEPSRAPGGELVFDFGAALAAAAAAHLGRRRVARLGAELSGVPGGLAPAATSRLAGACGAELVDASALFGAERRVKSAHEIECLRAAAAATDWTYGQLAAVLRIGMTERQIRDEVCACAARSQAEELRMVTVVAGATNPLAGTASDRVWSEGELLMIDLGLKVRGYWSDLSRHFIAGAPTAAQRGGYARLRAAFEAGRDAARAGARAADVNLALAAELPQVEGRATGRLGHGIGLEVTEPPSLAAIDPTPLAAGIALCLEPHAWFDGAGYMIGEEMIAVAEGPPEMLSPAYPAELTAIERS